MKIAIAVLAIILSIIYFFKPETKKLNSSKPIVVVSFSILEDLVKNICGDKYQIITIVERNSDAHVFRPKPMTSELISKAELVFINGLGLEGWIDRLITATNYKGAIITVSQGLPPSDDPHAWNDVANVKVYVKNITDAFVAHDPANKEFYLRNQTEYLQQLDKLDQDIRAGLKNVPREKRQFITAHDAFQYFGRAYDVEVLAPVGVSTEQEASAKKVGLLIDYIKKSGIKTVFVENITNEKLIRQIASETGAKLGGVLYSDALSALDGPAATYLDLMRHNFKLIYAAMME